MTTTTTSLGFACVHQPNRTTSFGTRELYTSVSTFFPFRPCVSLPPLCLFLYCGLSHVSPPLPATLSFSHERNGAARRLQEELQEALRSREEAGGQLDQHPVRGAAGHQPLAKGVQDDPLRRVARRQEGDLLHHQGLQVRACVFVCVFVHPLFGIGRKGALVSAGFFSGRIGF